MAQSSATLLATLGFLLSAATVLLCVIYLAVGYNDRIVVARKNAQNFAAILAEHVALTFDDVDQALRRAEEIRRGSLSGALDRASVSAALRGLRRDSPILVGVGWTDAAGNVLAHSFDGPPRRRNISGMPHFVAQRDSATDEMFIAPPFRSAVEDKWLIAASRRLANADGSFAGVVSAPLDQSYFGKLYRSVDLGAAGTIVLLHHQGQILAREPEMKDAIGRSFAGGTLFERLRVADAGSFEAKSAVDGVDRIAGYKSVPGLPLVLLVTYARSEVLAPWYAYVYTFGLLAAAIVIFILFGTMLIIRQTNALATKSDAIARTNRRFDAALSNMPHGLSMFDAGERLLVANSRYRDIYGLTEAEVKPGTPLKAILRSFEARSAGGEFSPSDLERGARERVPQLFKLADGRIILITRTPMEGGGWVATHQDITEQRKVAGQLADKAAVLERMNVCFDAALNNMSQGLCLFDADRRVMVANHKYAEIYHLGADEIKPGTPLEEIFAARERQGTAFVDAAKSLRKANENEAFRVEELVDGRFVAITHHHMAGGGWLTAHEDITERRKIEQERDRNRAFLNQIISHIPILITVKNAKDRRYVLLNRAAEAAVGPSGNVLGKTAHEVFSRQAADLVTEEDECALRSESGMYQAEHEFEISRGNIRFFTTKRVTIRDEDGEPTHLINLVEDVTERKVSVDRIAHLAHHDQLTGLANRAHFAEKLDEVAKRCMRLGTSFTVLMLDLDKFKYVNDTLGHPAGDQLLIEVARRLKSSLRETDVLARLGGDEFAIIQEGESNQREGAIGLALRIIELIGAPFDLGGHEARIGTSIGIALAPECGLDTQGLMKKADLALYEAKSEGRNDYRLFKPEMAEVSDTQKLLEGELRQAVQNDEFELFYQPVVDARTGLPCGAEALVRWRHPTRGPVMPEMFIPLAESTGLMMPLGEWILQRACRDAASWPSHLKVAVNISAVQFNSGRLFDIILCALVESGLSPERLELEITETMLLRNEQECLVTIRQLKNLGIAIVLDDFGVGYSSSSYLTRVPFDKIKIDKSFVQGFPQRRECAAIIHAVLALARDLDMSVTAEGVETREQCEALRTAGVTLIQGHLYGRPVMHRELAWDEADPKSQNVA